MKTDNRKMKRAWCALLVMMLACLVSMPSDAADPDKVLRYVFPAPETGFDPAVAHDLYSSQVIRSICEPLYTYDYLARPARLVPLTADGMPEISDGGKIYTVRVKKGIFFASDAAFNGKPRELAAADFAYAIKRLADPTVRSAWGWLVEDKVAGLSAWAKMTGRSGRPDYSRPVKGLEIVDRYTLRIRLNKPDYNFTHILAHYPTCAMAREVVEKYGDASTHVMANPVGTGAYTLDQWKRGSRIVLVANPDFRGFIWDFAAGSDPENFRIVEKMRGKSMPQIGRVEISVIPEDQSRWLAFQSAEVDMFNLDGPLAPKALAEGRLRPELVAKGIQLSRTIDAELSHYYFNMQNPVLGGMEKEKIALRRAIAMAHNVDEEIRVVWNGEAIPLEYPIPPGVVGHDPDYKSSVRYEPAVANALLDRFGYTRGKDGWRIQPDGSPLEIVLSARADSTGQQQSEMWKKTFDSLGIRMKSDKRLFPDLLKAEKQCQLMMRTSPWIADYPDGDNFMQLFYGPHVGQSNNGCMKIPEFDALYEQSVTLPDGEERNLLYHKMARILEVYAPTRIGYARYRNMLLQPYIIGYKKHPVMHSEWIYIDMDKKEKQARK
ncbi:ABC transporter substrate-binding protein [Oxalobacter vibrioformis]|uniref:ABC transporter substrate-binding protein n=1 Tax=Oxalobacter vibrioformis TaxID=933080 RepID=A0A9E9LVQ2_9BURK|nr:ABC transporter substrate-binding protein [Oxalobacter vibrioformis]WAW09146.1 ABC transporter substrate-binding protein [Oxalobacter vibrioformis]